MGIGVERLVVHHRPERESCQLSDTSPPKTNEPEVEKDDCILFDEMATMDIIFGGESEHWERGQRRLIHTGITVTYGD